jgi:ATP/maltotriose-dependent transcriptional regulator MalT
MAVLVGRSGLSPVMVGRSGDLDRLVALVGSGRTPSVALVAGEAGVGKTRLVSELIAQAPPATKVLVGQADPGALGRPLELLLDAVEREPDADRELLAVVADRSRASDERLRAGLDLVRQLTAGVPGLVVFDDLHWADTESVSLFERLADPDGGQLLVLGTYRPDALSRRHPASELLPRLERRHTVTHVHLDRLGPSDVAVFLTAVHGRSPSYRVVQALHARTGGNPFFLEELLAAAGDRDPETLCAQPLPWSIAELVRTQLDDLDPTARRLVETASVLGRRVPFDLLATVTRTTEDELIADLRTLVDRGLLVEDEADVFRFRHALMREAVEEGLLGRERRRLHEAALDALREAGSGDFADIAHHARGAGRYDEMVAAAREGARRYLALGSSYQALQLAELGLSEAEDDCELLGLAARTAWLAGLMGDAAAHAARWLDAARRQGDVGAEAAALGLQTRAAWEAGDIGTADAAAKSLESALDQVPDEADRGRAMAMLAQAHMLRDRMEDAVAWADRALAVADRLALDDLRLAALVEKGSALLGRYDTAEQGAAVLVEVAEEAERAGEDVVAARALHNLARVYTRPVDTEQTKRWLEQMREAATRAGFDSMASAYVGGLADLAEWNGDLVEALELMERVQRDEPDHLRTFKGGWYVVHRAGLLLEAGELGAAARLVAERPRARKLSVSVAGLDAHLCMARGDVGGARAALGKLLTAIDAEGWCFPRLVHDVTSAGLRGGLTAEELRPLVDRAAHAAGKPLDADDPWRQLLHAQLAEADHRSSDALSGYEAAVACEPVAATEKELLPANRATAHIGAARCLIALGRLEEAKVHADHAEELLRRWRGWRVDELRAVQRRLGRGPEVAGPAALTPREREVVELLAEGLSNADLAERLFISRKTAAVHVSNILAKLGMTSRVEVAAWAVESRHRERGGGPTER